MKIISTLLLILTVSICSAQVSAQSPPCATEQVWEHMARRDPSLAEQRRQMDQAIAQYADHAGTQHSAGRTAVATTVIPTAIYVVYDNPATNIGMAQIQSQMDQLNQDFAPYGYSFCYARRRVSDTAYFAHQAGDSSGVFRISSPLSSTGALTTGDAQLKALGTLPAANYLRIFIVNTITPSTTLAYATYPGTSAAYDGVVIRADVFGSNNICSSCQLYPGYNKGAALTHEVGHYLDLYHTFQGGCPANPNVQCQTTGDQVCDTPPTDGTFGCPATAPLSCNGVDYELIENYMDYTEDRCKTSFTPGQKARMDYAVLAFRQNLISTQNLIATGVTCAQIGDHYADFYSANYNGCTGKAMTFASLGATGYTYSWDWGDGTTAVGDTVSHIYTSENHYQVSLTAVNTSQNINVTRSIPVYITPCYPSTCSMNKLNFEYGYLDFSTGTPVPLNHPFPSHATILYAQPNFYNSYYRGDNTGHPLFVTSVRNGSGPTPYRTLSDSTFHIVDSFGINLGADILMAVPGRPNIFCFVNGYYKDSANYALQHDSLGYSIIDAQHGPVHIVPGKRLMHLPYPGSRAHPAFASTTAIPNCDGSKLWLIVSYQDLTAHIYQLDSTATLTYQFTTTLPIPAGSLTGITPSPDGRKVAFTFRNSLFIADFDKSTGTFGTAVTIYNSTMSYGNGYTIGSACFSPSSRFLYYAGACCSQTFGNTNYLYQYDLYNANPMATRRPVYQYAVNAPAYEPHEGLKVGPDGKIYLGENTEPGNKPASYRLGVINYPDKLENGLNVTGLNRNGPYIVPPACPYWGVTTSGFIGFSDRVDARGCDWQPDVPRHFSYAATACRSYKFYADECYTAQWDFGDAASGTANTSTLTSPAHAFSRAGDYTVTLVMHGYTFTDTVHVSAPSAQIGATSISPCPAPHANYSIAAPQPWVSYSWTITHGVPAAVQNVADLDVVWSAADSIGTVSVIATDTVMGCSDTAVLTVRYHSTDSAVVQYIQASICTGGKYHFHNHILTAAGTYSDTTITDGCRNITNLTLQVTQLTVSWTGGTVSLSSASAPVTLTGGTPPGGAYSGAGVSGGNFIPGSGPGAHIITYTYTDSSGCSGSATRTFNVVLGIADIDIESQIKLYPNPTNNKLTVESELFTSAAVQLAVYDMTGRQMLIPVEWQSGKALLTLSGISDGVYSVRMSIDGQEITKRFVKME